MRARKLLCRSQTRIDLLFTMSDITHAAVHPDQRVRIDVSRTILLGSVVGPSPLFELRRGSLRYDPARLAVAGVSQRRLVEPDGIEPTTSCLQSTRSPS
jgi:hypothetical protein